MLTVGGEVRPSGCNKTSPTCYSRSALFDKGGVASFTLDDKDYEATGLEDVELLKAYLCRYER